MGLIWAWCGMLENWQVQEIRHSHQPNGHRVYAPKDGTQKQPLKGSFGRHSQIIRLTPDFVLLSSKPAKMLVQIWISS